MFIYNRIFRIFLNIFFSQRNRRQNNDINKSMDWVIVKNIILYKLKKLIFPIFVDCFRFKFNNLSKSKTPL